MQYSVSANSDTILPISDSIKRKWKWNCNHSSSELCFSTILAINMLIINHNSNPRCVYNIFNRIKTNWLVLFQCILNFLSNWVRKPLSYHLNMLPFFYTSILIFGILGNVHLSRAFPANEKDFKGQEEVTVKVIELILELIKLCFTESEMRDSDNKFLRIVDCPT